MEERNQQDHSEIKEPDILTVENFSKGFVKKIVDNNTNRESFFEITPEIIDKFYQDTSQSPSLNEESGTHNLVGQEQSNINHLNLVTIDSLPDTN